MPDYTPAFFPGEVVTFTAGAAITGGNMVKVGVTDFAVVPATTDVDTPVGVAAADAANGARIPVYVRNAIHRLVAQGAITRGDHVSIGTVNGSVHTSAAQGAGYVQADANRTSRAEVGIALESAADTAIVRVMFI